MSAPRRQKLGALGFPLSESPADVQLAWKKEIERRREEIRAGRAVMIPAEVAMRRARRMLARMDRQRHATTTSPLISTGLQPGERGKKGTSAASAASPRSVKAAKAAGHLLSRQNTALKRGANEKVRKWLVSK